MRRFKFIVKRLVERFSPEIYVDLALIWFRLIGKNNDRLATKKSDICIEGFPRSANSFAVSAFRLCYESQMNIATHMHSHANVYRAISLGIPTLVLIRKPKDSIISLRSLAIERAFHKNEKIELISIKNLIEWYISFYTFLMDKKDKFVIGEFSQVTDDMTVIIRQFNIKYNTNFIEYTNLEEKVRNAEGTVKRHMFPTEMRKEIKERTRSEFETPEIIELLNRANEVYFSFVN